MIAAFNRLLVIAAASVVVVSVGGSFIATDNDSALNMFKRTSRELVKAVRSTSAKKVEPSSAPTYPEESVVVSNFDIQSELIAATSSKKKSGSAGSFTLNCGAGKISRDDPVMHAGQADASHLQEIIGNQAASASSSYASLRMGGDSTCTSRLDRSHYAVPAMLDGRGNVVRPDYISVTFTRHSPSHNECIPGTSQTVGICIPLPNGLRFAFGFDGGDGAQSANLVFQCGSSQGSRLADVTSNCSTLLRVSLEAPSCWDGTNLDSADHRSHMAYPSSGWFSGLKCPSSHPFYIPKMKLSANYTVDSSVPNWRYTSDETVPGARPGTTFQARWMGAWDNQVMAMWVDNCINRQLDCVNANLGNGKAMRRGSIFKTVASPRLVPLPNSPTPDSPTPDTVTRKVLATEGDSISYTWGGNHTGMYANFRKDSITHCGLAVGGSGIEQMAARSAGVTGCNPGVLTILIGANDLANVTANPTTQAWLNKLWAYTDAYRARGIKVAVGTVLPQYVATNATYNTTFAQRRIEANAAIRQAVGSHIDAVIDYAADPVMGPDFAARDKALFQDGVHPTDGCGMGCGGQGKLAAIYQPVVDRLLGVP